MKINPSHPNDESEAKKNNKPNWQSERRRRMLSGETDAAVKYRLAESPIKEEMKFVNILDTAAKPQKLKQTGEDSSQERRDDDKKDKKQAVREGDSSDNRSGNDRIERHNSSSGGGFGGSSSGGFGEGNVNQTINLSENFAARSILHIADLERMISAIRTQTGLGGKREIYLELKRSVMEGLKVKITTDPAAQVQIEFLAANEKVRSQIENHSEELTSILRGRGINLQSLRTTLDFNEQDNSPSPNDEAKVFLDSKEAVNQNEMDNSVNDNTFENKSENKAIVYRS